MIDKIDKDKLIELDEHLRSRPISEEKKGRSEATINHYFGLLKTFFNYAVRKKHLLENPVKEVRPYTVDEKRREYTPESMISFFTTFGTRPRRSWSRRPWERGSAWLTR